MDRKDILNSLRSYDPGFDEAKVSKALDFTVRYHGNQTRESGELYYHHPLEVAEIIVSMQLDSNAVIAALLHDTIEDTELTLVEIEKNFGTEVAKLVDGVTKLSKIEFIPDHLRQAENFRKLLLAMSEDIRVLLIKLADRLHNMRTIDATPPKKRIRIALETMEIYAPLAERIGVQQIKSELQDICFRVLQPEARESILKRLEIILSNEEHLLEKIVEEIKETVHKEGIEAQVYGRRKSPYSIWMKMQQKNIGLDQLADIIAFRIIVKTIPQCYQVLGIIHTKYKMVPENFQDFISTPKNNGYQSLHTLVIGPMQQKVEAQIRTEEMHAVAELGVAAHWRYKQKYQKEARGKQYRWLQDLLAIMEHGNDPEDFLQNTKLAMHYDQIFCFTPKGNLIALPKGASTVDFAYAVHSDIGQRCVGAKVNGKVVPLNCTLRNGDQVEIITSSVHSPSPTWEKFIVTGKARSEIKRFIRSQQKEQYIKLGRTIINKMLISSKVKDIKETLTGLCQHFQKSDHEELFHAVGQGQLSRNEILQYINSYIKKSEIRSALSFLPFRNRKSAASAEKLVIPIKGLLPGMAVHFASCCHPIMGDNIVGLMDPGSGITIHIADCEKLLTSAPEPERLVSLEWEEQQKSLSFAARLKVVMVNELGSLSAFCTDVAKNQGNIINLKVTNRKSDFFEFLFDVEVGSAGQLENMIHTLNGNPVVTLIERLK